VEAADRERLLAGVRQFYGPVTFNRLVGLVPAIRAGGRLGPAEVLMLRYVKEMTNLRVDTDEGAFVAAFDGAELMPEPELWVRQGRILADTGRQSWKSAWAPVAKFYYEDKPFTCVDCGSSEVWKAEQQQWWYEVAGGTLESEAIRCRRCRKAKRVRDGKRPPDA
jgi:hypothetical protein